VRAIARREALRIAVGDRAEPELPDVVASVEPGGDEVHLRVDVARALGVLSAWDRTALAGRYWMDLSDTQLASRLGVPPGTLKIRLHRARHKLRLVLGEETGSAP
jgi:DNA-directed RNA polymerase specialized sigma24 family protein